MYVLKRDGRKEVVHFDKITSRINKLCYGLDHVHGEQTFASASYHFYEWIHGSLISHVVISNTYSFILLEQLTPLLCPKRSFRAYTLE